MVDGVRISAERVAGQARELGNDQGFDEVARLGAELRGHGIIFGTNLSGEPSRIARQKYADALAGTEANLRAYANEVAALTAAAEAAAAGVVATDDANADDLR